MRRPTERQGPSRHQLQDLLDVDRDTVSLWITHYEQSGLKGLLTRPRPGRNPIYIYTDGEIQQLKGLIDGEPRLQGRSSRPGGGNRQDRLPADAALNLKIGSATLDTAAAVR